MSETKRPFDAAIEQLEVPGDCRGIDCEDCISRRNAIRVLETAGKVDKKNALTHFSGNPHIELRNEVGMIINTGWMLLEDSELYTQLRALIESLPDKEKK